MSNILLVSDEADITLYVLQVLDGRGFRVDSYEDPIALLANFKPRPYDLVVIDNKMPKMNGLTFKKIWSRR